MNKNNSTIKTIFIGTPDFALPSLQALINDERFEVVAVITQPDKKVGRKQILTPPPVKALAEKYNLPVIQPDKIKNFELGTLNLELIVVVAYAQIIPVSILNLPKYGCINVHGSLLPKYRGAACIQAAIANGDSETGITIMKMDKGLDTGPIIYQEKISIDNNDTTGILFNKMSDLGGKILPSVIIKYINQELPEITQDELSASYVGLIKKIDGKISWNQPAEKIDKFIRSRQPWPGAFSEIFYPDTKISIIKIIEVDSKIIAGHQKKIGEIFSQDNLLLIQCRENIIKVKKIQLGGKNIISADEFLRGHKNLLGQVLR